jgi:kynurenine formamidase
VVGFDFPQDYDIRRLHKVDLNEIDLTTHDVLLANDILMIEYLSNLWKVPVQNVYIYALPLNLKNADGAQIRVVASF